MKKFLIAALLTLPLTLTLASCKKDVDYFSYVSEYRKCYYQYEDDDFTVKIYSVDRENPAAMDGVRGSVSNLTEVYFSCEKSVNEVEAQLLGYGGDMSYLAVTRNFYLSFTGVELTSASIPVTFIIDGEEKKIDVLNVAEEGTIDGAGALRCVREYDAETFKNLTNGNYFEGEIYIRLLYDDGCYYYVGVCDRQARVKAYLVDGESGRIIAERESSAD